MMDVKAAEEDGITYIDGEFRITIQQHNNPLLR